MNDQLTISINKICDTLRTTEIGQAFHTLYDKVSGDKCALGVLSCEHYKDLTKNYVYVSDYNLILQSCGVPDEFTEKFMDSNMVRPDELSCNISLSSLITILNDHYELSFAQIADYLETTFIPE